MNVSKGLTRFAGLLLVGGVVGAGAACDFDVVNPGPVQDAFLAEPAAQPALVNGAGRAVAEAMNWINYTNGAVAREYHPSGSTGSFGITLKWQRGELPDDETDTHWNNGQRARWLAENAIAIISEAGESEPGLLAKAQLWAGYANRVLGENMCQAVIDGGAPMPHTEYLNRAEANFSAAMGAGGDIGMAATAGRASVRAQLGNWSGAMSDAGSVPDGFSYLMPYYTTEGDNQRHRLVWATFAEPYKAHTQWNTWVEDYGLEPTNNPNGDPRVSYRLSDEDGDAAIDCCGTVPWWPQTKHADSGGDAELSSGAEMRLLEAENALYGGDMATAMSKINALRTAAGMNTETAASMADAWRLYKREHAIEMWLEGRRLPALRRWNDAGLTETDLHIREQVAGPATYRDAGKDNSHLLQRDYCFPIPESEQDTNTNVG